MLRLVLGCAVFLFPLSIAAQPATAPAPNLRERAERVAAALPWLAIGDALYESHSTAGPDAGSVVRLMASLRGEWTAEDARPLLRHPDPRVRTLGIVVLFGLERLDVLPDIARLTQDAATTFPAPGALSAVPGPPPDPWPMDAVTVGDYATAAIDAYVDASSELTELHRAGRLARGDAVALTAQMAQFAARRDARLSTAGLRVAMDRATGRMSPLQPERQARVEAVLDRLQDVPASRRFFAALAIEFDRYRAPRYSSDYLLRLARQLPRDARLAAVRGQCAADDPDVRPMLAYDYLLDHAVDLFLASDADLFLRLEQPGRGASRYVEAAAALRPRDADAILTAGLGRYGGESEANDRARLAAALALTGSDAGLRRAVDWAFHEQPQAGAFGFGREAFLGSVQMQSPARFRQLVARFVRDERLNTLGPRSTFILMESVEGYLGRRLTDDDDVRACYSFDEAQRDGIFKPLADWQRLLRETADEWDR